MLLPRSAWSVLALVLVGVLAARSASAAHVIANLDVTSDPALSTSGPGDDVSPSLVGAPGGAIWYAWSHIGPTGSGVILAHWSGAPPLLARDGETDINAGAYTGVATTFDGMQPIVFVTSHANVAGTTWDVSLWRPMGGLPPQQFFSTSEAIGYIVTSESGSPSTGFDLGIRRDPPLLSVASTLVVVTGAYTTITPASQTFYSGAAGVDVARSVTGNATAYVIGSPAAGNVLFRNRDGTATSMVPVSVSAAAASIAASTNGEFVASILDPPTRVNTYRFVSVTPAPSAPVSVDFADPAIDIGSATDFGTRGVWEVSLLNGPERIRVRTEVDAVPTTPIELGTAYSNCSHLSVASTPAQPDLAFVGVSCIAGSARHVLFLVVQHDVVTRDAGADAAPDAIDDAAGSDVANGSDVTNGGDAAAIDTSTGGTGPDFRGGACACRIAGGPRPPDAAAVAAWVVATWAFARRRRRSRRGLARPFPN